MGQRGLLSAVFGKETRSFLHFCMTCMICMVCMVLYTLHGLNVLHDLHGLHDSPERRLPANHAHPKNHANHAFHSFRAAPNTQKPPRFTPQGFRFARSRHLPIFTGRVQPTIFGTSELNFCVRNGNRWGLTVIDTGRPEYVNQLALLFSRTSLLFCFRRTCLQN